MWDISCLRSSPVSIPNGKGKDEIIALEQANIRYVSIPNGKGKEDSKGNQFVWIPVYQFPMGKVKLEET